MSDYLDVDGLRVGPNMVRSYRERIQELEKDKITLVKNYNLLFDEYKKLEKQLVESVPKNKSV